MMDGLDLIGCEKHWTDIKGLGRPELRFCLSRAGDTSAGSARPRLPLCRAGAVKSPLWPSQAVSCCDSVTASPSGPGVRI